MPSIVTLTFSPCIDKSTSVVELLPEKKLKCAAPKYEPGGGGINVARAVKKLGGEATAIYPAGGFMGKFLTSLLVAEEVPTVVIDTKNETRENVIVWEENTKHQFRLGMPAVELSENEWKRIIEALAELKSSEFIVMSGGVPANTPNFVYSEIARLAKSGGAKLVVDCSGEALKNAVREGAFLVKPNLAELSEVVKKNYLRQEEIVSAARQAIEQYNCEVIVVSLGKAGAMVVTESLEETIVPPQVEVKSTVGAGDSMVAGIVLALTRGSDIKTAVQFGVACGTAATLNPGTGLCSRENADDLFYEMNALHSGKVW